ncbi:enamine deaminase RidA (YjgF/YER057c/UK114 family) [Bartonella silvatica]|uniref:Enamine deaminase RidA (YjgF/YER057c/UK114 family) n=1 Tax=Bartonella silvatica TaxID=357760 RepID=A0ABV2HHD0_9HYPH
MTNAIEVHLKKLGVTLPEAAQPIANYVTALQSGNQLFISGQLPLCDGKPIAIGKVGATVSAEQAKKAAEMCALNILSQIKANFSDLNRIKRVVKITVFVAVAPHFTDIPLIANGASDLFVNIFGDAGKHARSAIGVTSLPMDAPVEIEAIIEV